MTERGIDQNQHKTVPPPDFNPRDPEGSRDIEVDHELIWSALEVPPSEDLDWPNTPGLESCKAGQEIDASSGNPRSRADASTAKPMASFDWRRYEQDAGDYSTYPPDGKTTEMQKNASHHAERLVNAHIDGDYEYCTPDVIVGACYKYSRMALRQLRIRQATDKLSHLLEAWHMACNLSLDIVEQILSSIPSTETNIFSLAICTTYIQTSVIRLLRFDMRWDDYNWRKLTKMADKERAESRARAVRDEPLLGLEEEPDWAVYGYGSDGSTGSDDGSGMTGRGRVGVQEVLLESTSDIKGHVEGALASAMPIGEITAATPPSAPLAPSPPSLSSAIPTITPPSTAVVRSASKSTKRKSDADETSSTSSGSGSGSGSLGIATPQHSPQSRIATGSRITVKPIAAGTAKDEEGGRDRRHGILGHGGVDQVSGLDGNVELHGSDTLGTSRHINARALFANSSDPDTAVDDEPLPIPMPFDIEYATEVDTASPPLSSPPPSADVFDDELDDVPSHIGPDSTTALAEPSVRPGSASAVLVEPMSPASKSFSSSEPYGTGSGHWPKHPPRK